MIAFCIRFSFVLTRVNKHSGHSLILCILKRKRQILICLKPSFQLLLDLTVQVEGSANDQTWQEVLHLQV